MVFSSLRFLLLALCLGTIHVSSAYANDLNFTLDDTELSKPKAKTKKVVRTSEARDEKVEQPLDNITAKDREILSDLYLFSISIKEAALAEQMGTEFPQIERYLAANAPQDTNLVRQFFFGASPYFAAIRAENPLIAFYHPLYDSWIMIVVKGDKENLFTVVKTFVLDGKVMRDDEFDPEQVKADWVVHYETSEDEKFSGIMENLLTAEESLNETWPLLSDKNKVVKTQYHDQSITLLYGRIGFFTLNFLNALKNPYIEQAMQTFADAVSGDKAAMENIKIAESEPYTKANYASLFPWFPYIFLGDTTHGGTVLIMMPHRSNQIFMLGVEQNKAPVLLHTSLAQEGEE